MCSDLNKYNVRNLCFWCGPKLAGLSQQIIIKQNIVIFKDRKHYLIEMFLISIFYWTYVKLLIKKLLFYWVIYKKNILKN